MSTTIRRTIHPEIKVIDQKAGIIEYVASDESVDKDREVIKADGWRFDRFEKNAPFVDSHNYTSVDRLLGKVVGWEVKGDRLVETVQWAIDVPENRLAALGYAMAANGYLKSVSVGFEPVRAVTAASAGFRDHIKRLRDVKNTNVVKKIFLEQQQLELSACVVGVNPNALARAFKAGLVGDEDLDMLSIKYCSSVQTDDLAVDPALAESSRERERNRFLIRMKSLIAQL